MSRPFTEEEKEELQGLLFTYQSLRYWQTSLRLHFKALPWLLEMCEIEEPELISTEEALLEGCDLIYELCQKGEVPDDVV